MKEVWYKETRKEFDLKNGLKMEKEKKKRLKERSEEKESKEETKLKEEQKENMWWQKFGDTATLHTANRWTAAAGALTANMLASHASTTYVQHLWGPFYIFQTGSFTLRSISFLEKLVSKLHASLLASSLAQGNLFKDLLVATMSITHLQKLRWCSCLSLYKNAGNSSSARP